MKSKILLFGLLLTLITISCNKDKETDNSTITAEEAGVNAKIDLASDDVSNIVENQYENIDSNTLSYKNSNSEDSYFATCATITRVPAFGTTVTPGTQVTKTVDFGPTGCTLSNGNFVSGKIIITFIYDPSASSHTITYTFVNFYHNLIKYDGTKTFTITMSIATVASPSHPIVTMNMDMTATFPNGNVYTRVGQRISEIIEGFSTPSWTDNVYQVTGSWTTTFPNTVIQTSTITSPLHIKMSCISVNKPLIVSGVITFNRNSHTATLDYGNGDCDNLAIFTINGNSYNITIGN
ncbi:hypothetical protein [Flavobacterium sp.]|uniref:hypothetical protein n=1 Tax=Flavobacterium sp. TaxID=239 RepID=UPI0038FC345A